MPWRYHPKGEQLVDGLAALLRREGADAFLRGPILSPSEIVPDTWAPTLPAVGSILYRLSLIAGLGDHELEIEDRRRSQGVLGAPPGPGLRRGETAQGDLAAPEPALRCLGLRGDRLVFAVHREEALGPTVGAAAWEIVKAWVDVKGPLPGLDAPDRAAPDRAATHVAAATYLGFGALCVSAAPAPGADEGLGWRNEAGETGVSPPDLDALAFLLAAQLTLRAADASAMRRVVASAGDVHRAAVLRWRDLCAGTEIDLRERLGLDWEEPSSDPAVDVILGRLSPWRPLPEGLRRALESAEAHYRTLSQC